MKLIKFLSVIMNYLKKFQIKLIIDRMLFIAKIREELADKDKKARAQADILQGMLKSLSK